MYARSQNEVLDLHISSALDLREQPHACRKAMGHSVVTGVAVAPLELLPASHLLLLARLVEHWTYF